MNSYAQLLKSMQSKSSTWCIWLVLTVIILLGVIIRSSLLIHNLPVAWHVDERFLLRVLERLEKQNTLDPNFFCVRSLKSEAHCL